MTALSGAKHVYGVLVDITVHKEVQQRRDHEHVRQHEARRLRDFVAAMVAAQEEERRRVARELHDELAQQLVALMLGLETLRAESQGRPRALSRVEQLHEAAERLGRDVHRIAVELRPTALDDHGLRRALTTHAQRWSERFGIPVDLRLEDIETMRLPPDFETALFRIVQEALTNIARHAQAHHVTVTLTFASGQIVATIADDGVGFDATSPWTNAAVRERLGLLSMRERAVLIGGELAIDSVPDKGTVIVVRAPVERTQDSPDRLSGEP